MPMVV